VAAYAWLIPAIMAGSAALVIFFGRQFPKKGAEIGITAVAVCFALAIGVAADIWGQNLDAVHALEEAHAAEAGHAAADGAEVASAADVQLVTAEGEAGGEAEGGETAVEVPEGVHTAVYESSTTLMPMGQGFELEVGVRVDGLTAMMFLLVTFVSLMVHVYSTGYLHGDPRYTWYFGLLSLFTMSMLLLVIANNLMMLMVGWELVGVCSFLLIGFWWEEKNNSNAAIKAFITTKFGDVGLVVGVLTMWGIFGTYDIGAIIDMAQQGVQAGGAELNTGLLTFALISLFVGAIGKSAQFPLWTWLPDAMAGPTPVSALIHAATMVTAGVFLIARLYPVYLQSPTALGVIAVIGAITLFGAGLLAIVQDDVKRVLAYSTVSQLGYMIAGLAFSYTAGIFHLFTHGFFKALLFLGSGSLIHAVHSNNMSDMGGLRKYMPTTFWTFLVGSAALAAIPPLAGFWSKDEILIGAFGHGGYTGNLVLILGVLGGGLTAFYMTRACYLIFAGDYRGHGHPHESPPAMKWPLVALAVPAAVIGFINLPFDWAHPYGFAAWTTPSLEYFAGHPAEFSIVLGLVATGIAVLAILFGRALYRTAPIGADDPTLRMGLATRVLERKYYLDDLYSDLIVRTVVRTKLANASYWINDHVIDRLVYLVGVAMVKLGRATYEVGDQRGIDGAVNGLGVSAIWSGAKVKLAQSGNVQLYAGAMFMGVAVLAVVFAAA
jgi:NADH-quinone oxidoreductase subunit L